MTKINVKALQTFSHGNVDAKQGGVYAFTKGDAQELEKLGFVSMGGEDPEQTQVDQPPQKKNKGDVEVDDADDMLGESKMAESADNKMERPTSNKRK